MDRRLIRIFFASIIIISGAVVTVIAGFNIYRLALGRIISYEDHSLMYHIGYLMGSTIIMFIGLGFILIGNRLIRKSRQGAFQSKEALDSYKKARVAKPYESAYPDPLKLKKGEKLTAEKKESEWRGWLWCTDSKGISGWVPEVYLRVDGDTAVMLNDYDATELTVRPGDRLTILKEEGGWYLCLDADGRRGWVPMENVELI